MPDEYVIKPFIIANRAEVKDMFLTEYNEEKVKEQEREEGRKEGANLERECIASRLIKDGKESVSYIARITQLSEDPVRKLAQSLGIGVV